MTTTYKGAAEYPQRLAAFEAAIAQEFIYDDDGVDLAERYLLIERSIFDGDAFLTTYNSPEDAAVYHDSQELPEDWPVAALVDLDSGQHLLADTVRSTTFGPAPA